jgi:hypothetical protein
MSRAVDVDEHPNAAPGSKAPATSASCFIKAGWGITFDPADFALFKAIKPCPANTYGVANDTFGLINAPCKACTKNLYSLAGSTKFNDCLNPGGFGYTSEGANQVRSLTRLTAAAAAASSVFQICLTAVLRYSSTFDAWTLLLVCSCNSSQRNH